MSYDTKVFAEFDEFRASFSAWLSMPETINRLVGKVALARVRPSTSVFHP